MRTIQTLLCGVATSLLLATAALATEPVATPVAPTLDASQQTVCRRDTETGSLVRAKKTCHTRAQWTYIDDANQQTARKMVEDGQGKVSGN